MNRDLTNYRKSYEKYGLEEKDIPETPLILFSKWFKEVEEHDGVEEANAMTLTTTGQDGFPKGRIVLLKAYDQNGFVFYTNYTSEKAQHIEMNQKVCISFFWPNLERQVIIKGIASKVTVKKSEAYFNSRPRGSRLGAWASNQSATIVSRKILEDTLKNLEDKYPNETHIPKPDFWGGYCIEPISFEFWQGRPNRLHDRILFTKNERSEDWKKERLAP